MLETPLHPKDSMEAMLGLCVPHAPACRPDCLLSQPSRRNPLRRRHLAFPHDGARVAAAPVRLWAVCPQPPAGEDASRGRVEGWHGRRGAVVGPAFVLACSLRATSFRRGGRAHCSPPKSSGDVPPTSNLSAGGVEGSTLAAWVNVMSGTFRGPVVTKEPPALFQLLVDRINDEIRFLSRGYEKPSLLLLLLLHLSDQLAIHERSRLEASNRGLKTTSSLYVEWWELPESERKYNLGLLLIQIFIYQGDYERAKKICQHNKSPSTMDARPQFFMAIINTMLAIQRMLNQEKTQVDALIIKDMISEWEELLKMIQTIPPKPNGL